MEARQRTRRVLKNCEEKRIQAPSRLRRLVRKQAMNRKIHLRSTLGRDSVDEPFYDKRINIGGIQVTFTPRIFLQHALSDARLITSDGFWRGFARTLLLRCLSMPVVTFRTKLSTIDTASPAMAIGASQLGGFHTSSEKQQN
jgi:hypothetical protein